jgi:competence protein ComEC
LAGILLGIECRILEDLRQAYSATGTTHIIAISGFNITILAGLTITVLSRYLGRTRGLIVAGVIIALYTLFVGADAPVVRAAIMGTLALLARHLGRRTNGLTSLAAASMTMTLFAPQSIHDVGFQLSFAATLGLILYAEPLKHAAIYLIKRLIPNIDPRRWGNALAEITLFTLAAQLTTLPIIMWHFHQISLVSLIANAFILPLQPLLMILSGIAAIVGLIWHPLGQLIACSAWPFSALTNQLVLSLAETPGGVIHTGTAQTG